VHDELKKRGGRLLAVSVDPPGRSFQVVSKYSLNFPILGDVNREVIREYGLVHAKGAPDGSDIAIPSMFLLDREGRIVWRRVSSRIQDRVDPQEVLTKIAELMGR
jgi:peroxiredoxin